MLMPVRGEGLEKGRNEFDLKQAELEGSVGCLCREVKYLVTQCDP